MPIQYVIQLKCNFILLIGQFYDPIYILLVTILTSNRIILMKKRNNETIYTEQVNGIKCDMLILENKKK